MSDEERQEMNLGAMVPGMLAPLSGKLEYNPQRLQQEIEMLDRLEGVLISVIHFERGRRYNLMWETEQGPECPTFKNFLSQRFPDKDRREVYRDMKFALLAADLPNFRGLADCKGGWRKVRALMDNLSPEEIKELDETGDVRGLTVRQIEEGKSADVRKALKEALKTNEDLSQENAKLKEKVEVLEVAVTEPDVQAAFKIIREAEKKFMEGAALLRKITPELLEREETVRNLVFASSGMLGRLTTQMEYTAQDALNKVLAAEGDGDD
ncbi:MAG: hypothetical protein FJ121_13685 [Deltaproteobacteria bacterium]|nr:hypothetical protein [Deltaproteobacteria bacterium]